MKDSGLVLKTQQGLAVVAMECLRKACHRCSSKRLCTLSSSSSGLLKVKNPLKALPGDLVEVEIPEASYNKALILIFSTLIITCLLGLGLGYLISLSVSVSLQEASLAGVFLALLLASFGLYGYFHKKNNARFYPVITDILKKGDSNGQTPFP